MKLTSIGNLFTVNLARASDVRHDPVLMAPFLFTVRSYFPNRSKVWIWTDKYCRVGSGLSQPPRVRVMVITILVVAKTSSVLWSAICRLLVKSWHRRNCFVCHLHDFLQLLCHGYDNNIFWERYDLRVCRHNNIQHRIVHAIPKYSKAGELASSLVEHPFDLVSQV